MPSIQDFLQQIALKKRDERELAKRTGPATLPIGGAPAPAPDAAIRPGPPEIGAGFGRSSAQVPGNRPIPGVNDAGGRPVLQSGGDAKRAMLIQAIQNRPPPQAGPPPTPVPPGPMAPPAPTPPPAAAPPTAPPQIAPLPQPPLPAGMQLPPDQPGTTVGGQIPPPSGMGGPISVGGEAAPPAEGPADLGTAPPLNVSLPGPSGGGIQTSGEDEIARYIAQQQMEQGLLAQSRRRQDQIVEEMMQRHSRM